jgi:zinc protease
MKKLLFALAFIGLSLSTFGQIDRSIRPKPAPERQLKIGNAESFELKNGLKVIVVSDRKLPRITYSLIMDRKPINEGDKSGVADLMGEMLTEGTKNRTKEQLDEEIDFMGASLSTGSSSAFSSGLSKYKEELIALLADVVLNPSFPTESFDKLKKQSESALESSKEEPSAIAGNLVSAVLFGKDHPYGQVMTQASLEQIQLEDIKNMYAKLVSPENTYIAIVGDISKKEAKKLVKKYFKEWTSTATLSTEIPAAPATTATNTVHIVNRPASVQSVIEVAHTINLQPESADHMAVRVLNQILGGGSSARLFRNLREDKAYTYGAYSNINTDRYVGTVSATAEVRNEVTDSSITQLLMEINKISTEMVSDEELAAAKESLKGGFGRSLERPSTLASFALNTYRYNLPEDYYQNYLIKLAAVSKEDVLRVAKKYLAAEGYRITIVGKSADFSKKVAAFGPITYYDFEGNVTDAPIELPEGVNAESILANYFKGLGGLEKLQSIKTLEVSREASIQGINLKSREVFSFPNKVYKLQDMGPMGKIETIKNEGTFKFMQNGMETPLPEDQLADIKKEMGWIEELDYAKNGVVCKAVGMDEIGGKSVYMLEVNNNGDISIDFFDVASGLKLRTQETSTSEDGETSVQNVDYKNYIDKGGIMMPEIISIPVGLPMNLEFKLVDAKVDGKVDASLFSK